ncbi:MAG: hypothetical protein GX471_11065 [Candidatus Microthrix parvicella]|uniref:hypothetical protein n=1 Tax=Candidatus Neomicrothrix parvicella TaxID=41950 RepID=UPI0005541570|nr:hypothetical protein [Candidatus Microthrix parvicella]NLH66696.1 hypothetical protein [Candidatus Microthrix parvicella]
MTVFEAATAADRSGWLLHAGECVQRLAHLAVNQVDGLEGPQHHPELDDSGAIEAEVIDAPGQP